MQKKIIDNGYLVFLGLLICTDLLFIGLHLIHAQTSLLPGPLYSVTQNRGYAEIFQHIKQLWIVGLLALLFYKRASFTNFSWLLIFLYVLLDDALSIHENFGRIASEAWSFGGNFGLRPSDWGELLITAIAAFLLLTPAIVSYVRANTHEKAHTRMLLGLLGLLAFFGVFIDMVHVMLGDGWGVIEDGGEMLAISLVLYYVFRHCFENSAATASMPAAQAIQTPATTENAGILPAIS